MQGLRGLYVHDVVNALPQVVIQVLVARGGDAQEGGAEEGAGLVLPSSC